MREDKADGCLSEYNDIIKENEDIYRDFARKVGLSECSFWILYVLRTEYAAPIQSNVCACLHEPKQTVNSALKKLEADGFIELSHGSDRRSKRILLTRKGVSLCERTIDRVVKIEKMAFCGLSDEEQEQFLFLFHKITDLLKQYIQESIWDEKQESQTE